MRSRACLPSFLAALLSGCGAGAVLSPIEEVTYSVLFRDEGAVDPRKVDDDRDATPNAADVCARIAGVLGDLDADGLGDPCDPNPLRAEYPFPARSSPTPAADAQDFFGHELPSPTPPADDDPAVPVTVTVTRVCRDLSYAFLAEATNPIVELVQSSQARVWGDAPAKWRFPEGTVLRDELAAYRSFFDPSTSYDRICGWAKLTRDGRLPATVVWVTDEACKITDDTANFVRFCDDTDRNGTCADGETQYDPQFLGSLGTFTEVPNMFALNMKLTGEHSWRGEEDPECDGHMSSPLVLDLDGDGVSFSAPSVRFDLDANRTADLVGWPRGDDDAWLALDLDGDGAVTSGAELFGNHTAVHGNMAENGFVALAQYDSNGDGALTADDPIFARLSLWLDVNRDGRSQLDELSGLVDSGVELISLAYVSAPDVDAMGNESRQRSYFRARGRTLAIADVWVSYLSGH